MRRDTRDLLGRLAEQRQDRADRLRRITGTPEPEEERPGTLSVWRSGGWLVVGHASNGAQFAAVDLDGEPLLQTPRARSWQFAAGASITDDLVDFLRRAAADSRGGRWAGDARGETYYDDPDAGGLFDDGWSHDAQTVSFADDPEGAIDAALARWER